VFILFIKLQNFSIFTLCKKIGSKRDSNPRPCGHEAAGLSLHHRGLLMETSFQTKYEYSESLLTIAQRCVTNIHFMFSNVLNTMVKNFRGRLALMKLGSYNEILSFFRMAITPRRNCFRVSATNYSLPLDPFYIFSLYHFEKFSIQ
jgi:hypothetical protein